MKPTYEPASHPLSSKTLVDGVFFNYYFFKKTSAVKKEAALSEIQHTIVVPLWNWIYTKLGAFSKKTHTHTKTPLDRTYLRCLRTWNHLINTNWEAPRPSALACFFPHSNLLSRYTPLVSLSLMPLLISTPSGPLLYPPTVSPFYNANLPCLSICLSTFLCNILSRGDTILLLYSAK